MARPALRNRKHDCHPTVARNDAGTPSRYLCRNRISYASRSEGEGKSLKKRDAEGSQRPSFPIQILFAIKWPRWARPNLPPSKRPGSIQAQPKREGRGKLAWLMSPALPVELDMGTGRRARRVLQVAGNYTWGGHAGGASLTLLRKIGN